jgi:hypothetical protein
MEENIIMNIKRYTARMLSRFKTGLDSWISLWRFLVYLEDLNFYEGLDGCETERTDRYAEQATFTRRLKSDRARSRAAPRARGRVTDDSAASTAAANGCPLQG